MTKPELLGVGGWQTIARAEVYKGGAWVRITRAEVYTGGGWKAAATFTPPMTVTISPSPVTGAARTSSITSAYVTSALANAVIVGGEAPFTYAWSLVSGVVTIFTPNSATTQFGATVEPFDAVNAAAKLVVTDTNGTTATATVNIVLRNQPTV